MLNLQLQHETSTSTHLSWNRASIITTFFFLMELTDFMDENHTKVYTGYNYQSNIAMMSAPLIGWKQ